MTAKVPEELNARWFDGPASVLPAHRLRLSDPAVAQSRLLAGATYYLWTGPGCSDGPLGRDELIRRARGGA